MIIDDETVAVAAVLGYFLGVVVTIIVENKGFSKRKANPPKKRKGSVPKMFDPPSERIATLKTALYRTRRDRDKYKELYLSEKERADRHMERLREKRLELFKLKNQNQ